jgi:hypothetical protein
MTTPDGNKMSSDAQRRRAAQSTSSSRGARPSQNFDWDEAIARFKDILDTLGYRT